MRIVLTYTGSEQKHRNYVQWLQGDDDIEVLKVGVEDNNLDLINDCDALVLAGGRDIHPQFYKAGETDYPNSPGDFDVRRDKFEMAAFGLAQQNRIPVLGICRGMQLVNCFFGGTLQQDLGTVLNNIHKNQVHDKAHAISIQDNSLLSKIAKAERGIVNSAHHQAIHLLANGLKVNCTADDGTIEGLEWVDDTEKPFLLCVQWHPERMFQRGLGDSPLSKNIRHLFIEEIKKSKERT